MSMDKYWLETLVKEGYDKLGLFSKELKYRNDKN